MKEKGRAEDRKDGGRRYSKRAVPRWERATIKELDLAPLFVSPDVTNRGLPIP
jgi:hypothetical protein